MSQQISMKQLKSFVKKMQIKSGCVIVIKKDSPLASQEIMRDWDDVFKDTALKDIILLVTDNLSDVEVHTRQEMNTLGWYHIDQIRKASAINTVKQAFKAKEEATSEHQHDGTPA